MYFGSQEPRREVPFGKKDELVELGETIPGQPLILLNGVAAVPGFLTQELSTLRLKKIYKELFLVSNRDNISPLHHQTIKGRDVILTERPDLHLVWFYERIFLKPIPKCLLSYDFWRRHILSAKDQYGQELILEALGFLRTYSRLIIHESDFRMAQTLHLLPESITWERWCGFIVCFQSLRDREVALRYHYGEIRLTRLNLLHTIFRGSNYHQVHHNYATFFGRFGAPFLFFFGGVTVLLTAVQTGLAAHPDGGYYHNFTAFIVPLSLILTLFALILLPFVFFFLLMRELIVYLFCHRKLS